MQRPSIYKGTINIHGIYSTFPQNVSIGSLSPNFFWFWNLKSIRNVGKIKQLSFSGHWLILSKLVCNKRDFSCNKQLITCFFFISKLAVCNLISKMPSRRKCKVLKEKSRKVKAVKNKLRLSWAKVNTDWDKFDLDLVH